MVKIRESGHVRNKAIYVAIGVNMRGNKEVLGLWVGQAEGAHRAIRWPGALGRAAGRIWSARLTGGRNLADGAGRAQAYAFGSNGSDEVAFSGLHPNVAKQELDLPKLSPSFIAQTRAAAATIAGTGGRRKGEDGRKQNRCTFLCLCEHFEGTAENEGSGFDQRLCQPSAELRARERY
jgi:hypothetical protein